MKHVYTAVLLILLTVFFPGKIFGESYEERRDAFIENALTNFNDDAITLQAYKNLPVDEGALTRLIYNIQTASTADFGIVKLIRVLFLTNGEYDDRILPVLNTMPYWLTKGEDWLVYWSENHMIMWMSSDWLLHEKYGREIDENLRNRLVHFLRLKIDYGYYEFFSSVYAPYSLSGLLNLADFAEDPEIKNLATQAAQRLMKELLLITNDKGAFFPSAGRNYNSKYETAYNQNHSKIIYLLTGLGITPDGGSHASNFLASSSIDVQEVISSWVPELNVSHHIGHSLQEGFQINSEMAPLDKVMFQFSSGAYFHPDVADETARLMHDYDLWGHSEFSQFSAFSSLPVDLAKPISLIAGSISRSSLICGQTVDIFKKNSIVLSSIQDFWKGRVGYQQWPWAATTGTAAVFTQAGEVGPWNGHGDNLSNNTTLPYIEQDENVALIMYRPNADLPIFGYDNFDVALKWPTDIFHETRENGNWLLARENDSYIAVRRHCTDYNQGIPACTNQKGQAWAVVVGNEEMYGSFDDFEEMISEAVFREKWIFNFQGGKWIYFARIKVAGKDISYSWGGSILQGPKREAAPENELTVYPNPARDHFSIDLSSYTEPVSISVVNMLGQEVHKQLTPGGSTVRVETNGWDNGMYSILFESGGEIENKKLIISK